MVDTSLRAFRVVALGTAAMIIMPSVSLRARPQDGRGRDWRDMDWSGNVDRLTRIEPGAFVTVRTTEPIVSDRADGRIFGGAVADDVWDDYRRLTVPVIPRGSPVLCCDSMINETSRPNSRSCFRAGHHDCNTSND